MATADNQHPSAESSPRRPLQRRGGGRARAAHAVTAVLPERGSARHHGVGFWAVALTFLTLAAFTTVPSPLYGLYQARDGFSEFMVTVIYAAYAIGVVGALAFAGHLSDWFGRRRLLIPAAGLTIASAIVFLTWTSVPGLLLARVLSGIAIGITSSTATAYLAELHAGHRPGASGTRAQITATTVNMGGLGVGALVAGLLAQWVGDPLTVPYVVFLIAAALARVGAGRGPRRVLRRRAQRVHRVRGDGPVRRPVRSVPARRAAPPVARARRRHAVRRLLSRGHRTVGDRHLAAAPRARRRHGADGARPRGDGHRRVAACAEPRVVHRRRRNYRRRWRSDLQGSGGDRHSHLAAGEPCRGAHRA